MPKTGVNICLPTINISEYLTSSSLCLKTYQERVSNPGFKNSIRAKYKGKNCIKRNKRSKSESESKESETKPMACGGKESEIGEVNPVRVEECSEEKPEENGATAGEKISIDIPNDADMNAVAVKGILSLQQTLCAMKELESKEHDGGTKDILINHVVNSRTETKEKSDGEIKSSSHQQKHDEVPKKSQCVSSDSNSSNVKLNSSCVDVDNCDVSEPNNREEKIAQIREGWTMDTIGTITIGELYLMVKKIFVF